MPERTISLELTDDQITYIRRLLKERREAMKHVETPGNTLVREELTNSTLDYKLSRLVPDM